MKKIANILLLMGALMMALSCIGTEGLNEIPEGEICMSPVLSDMAMTRAGDGITPYPDGSSFGAFAYYTNAEAGDAWTATPQTYFQNHEFKSTDGLCTGVEPVYWPFSGSLIFAGYSPYDDGDDVTFNATTKTLTIKDYEVDGSTDLMYFLPALTSDKEYKGEDQNTAPVEVTFNHALSCVAFSFLEGKGGKTVTLKEVKLASVYTKGDMNVEASDPKNVKWTPSEGESETDFVIWNEDMALSSTAFDVKAFIIPSRVKNIIITYNIDGENDLKTETITPTPDDVIKDWAAGTRCHYTITINSMSGVNITPDVEFFHKYDEGGVLLGSRVEVNLGLSSEDMARVSNLNIDVEADGILYKSYSNTIVPSNLITFDSGEKLYLPQENNKEYTVTFSYDDGLGHQEVSVVVTPPEPIFALNMDVLTRPKLAWNKPAQIIVRNASLTISDEVLKEISAKVVIQFGSTSYRRFGSESVTTSHFIQNDMQPMGVWNGDVTTETSEVEFDGIVISYNETFYVPSSYKKGAQIINAEQLKDGAKYLICMQANSDYYWYGDGKLKYSKLVDTYTIKPDYVFIYARDDSQKRTDLDKRYSYSSAGAWICNYDWTYVDENFGLGNSPSYFTCANGWRSSQYGTLIEGADIDIYHLNKGAGDMLNRNWDNNSNYPEGYFWGNGDTVRYKWNIYEAVGN